MTRRDGYWVCGETSDHEYEVTSEDKYMRIEVCQICGAETWEDKDE